MGQTVLGTEDSKLITLKNQGNLCCHQFVVSTDSIFYQAWKITILVLSFASSFQYAFLAAFDSTSLNDWSTSEIFYEMLFCFAMILNFFTEFHYPSLHKKEHHLKVIALNYLQTTFARDVAALVPFREIFKNANPRYKRLFHLIKLIRLSNGFQYLSHKVFMKEVKTAVQNRI